VSDEFRIARFTAGVEGIVDILAETLDRNSFHTFRIVLEESGADALLRAYYALASAQDDLSNDVVLKVNITDPSPVANSSPTNKYTIEQTDAGSIVDEFFLCGRNIVVSGLKTGQKVQVDSRTAVVESGGSVTLDVDTWALPATTIKILSGAGTEITSLTPSTGIWGGDIYSADVTDPPIGEAQFNASVEVAQNSGVQVDASMEVEQNSAVQVVGSTEVAQHGEIQIISSVIVSQHGVVQLDASMETDTTRFTEPFPPGRNDMVLGRVRNRIQQRLRRR
ncbi:hypothetical protein LCGC14_2246060, partial [marine sediment metagenome]